jgi:hypothetical protein
MTPQQALQVLAQYLITKSGLSLQEIAAVLAAWNTVAEAVKPEGTG